MDSLHQRRFSGVDEKQEHRQCFEALLPPQLDTFGYPFQTGAKSVPGSAPLSVKESPAEMKARRPGALGLVSKGFACLPQNLDSHPLSLTQAELWTRLGPLMQRSAVQSSPQVGEYPVDIYSRLSNSDCVRVATLSSLHIHECALHFHDPYFSTLSCFLAL
jgi:hypothetical protein